MVYIPLCCTNYLERATGTSKKHPPSLETFQRILKIYFFKTGDDHKSGSSASVVMTLHYDCGIVTLHYDYGIVTCKYYIAHLS